MTKQISYQRGVTLVGGAVFDAASLHEAIALAPHVVAADGGADRAIALDIEPEIVIGDMDSLHSALPARTRRIHIEEQDTTDFGKCLYSIDAPFYIAVGFLGGRLDHTLATLSVMLEHRSRRIVAIGEEDVAFIAPPDWSMAIDPGARVSLFPLRPCKGVKSKGLRWPIDGLSMMAGGQIGTSNEASGSRIAASFEPSDVVTMLPRRYLATVLSSLQ